LLFASSFDASFSVIKAGGEVFFGEDIESKENKNNEKNKNKKKKRKIFIIKIK
jgi:hypothetical protein